MISQVYYLANSGVENIDLFLVRPGDGEQFVYSPVEVNATLNCAVNNTSLSWDVDELTFDIDNRRDILISRGIFQSTNTIGAIIQSTLTVYGDIDVNNNTKICCQYLERIVIRESCTTLVIYGKLSCSYCSNKMAVIQYNKNCNVRFSYTP